MAAYRSGGGTLIEPGEAAYVSGSEISAGLFSVLGVRLERGRDFIPEEDRSGGTPVAIISYSLWQSRFGGRAGTVGSRLVLDGRACSVVGSAPLGFRFFVDDEVLTP
jgi:hypothetical protein